MQYEGEKMSFGIFLIIFGFGMLTGVFTVYVLMEHIFKEDDAV